MLPLLRKFQSLFQDGTTFQKENLNCQVGMEGRMEELIAAHT